MKAVLNKQKDALADLTAKNAVLVAENSKLRMNLSFMPVQYREFAAHHQQTNSALYQDQRRDPKVITPRSTHLKGDEITWTRPCLTPWFKSACATLFTARSSSQRAPSTMRSSSGSVLLKTKLQNAFHSRNRPLPNTTPSLMLNPPSGLALVLIAITFSYPTLLIPGTLLRTQDSVNE